jgi:hypothetical protein
MLFRSLRVMRLPAVLSFILVLLLAVACGGGSEGSAPSSVVVSTVEATAVPAATVAPKPNAPMSAQRPATGKWIDVDLTRLEVQLLDGDTVLRTIGPIAIGEQVNTGVFESTQTGLFEVYVKTRDLTYDAPYDTYISDWVGFDPDKANGFHSFLKDKNGNVVDAGTGRISNGCICTGDATAIYEFAQVGMPVLVHL